MRRWSACRPPARLFALGVTTVNCHAYDANLNTKNLQLHRDGDVGGAAGSDHSDRCLLLGGTFNLSFTAVNGLTYYVEYAKAFDGSVNGQGVAWTTIQTINGDSQVHSVSHTPAGGTKGFYRVRTEYSARQLELQDRAKARFFVPPPSGPPNESV